MEDATLKEKLIKTDLAELILYLEKIEEMSKQCYYFVM